VQVKCLKVRDSKYGTALVVETSEFSGGYILGFRVENLEEVYTEATNLFKTYSLNPIFGVEVTFEDVDTNLTAVTIPRVEDNLEIIETGYSFTMPSNKAVYAIGGGKSESEQIIFSEDIGLAIEKPPNGMSLEQLWKIV
jgi:Bardet-Biedl syndrome 5 protein